MEFAFGIFLIVTGGLLEGVFTLGLLKTPNWKWEHLWGLGSLFALILAPLPVALLTVPRLFEVYQIVPAETIVVTALFGLGWGIGGIFLGLGVSMVGLALGISLMMGLIAVFGSAGPLLIRNAAAFLEPSGMLLSAGLLIMIAGVAVCALAGKRRVQDTAGEVAVAGEPAKTDKKFVLGLVICVLSGLLSPLLNYAFIFGDEIRNTAVSLGAGQGFAVNAIWAIVFIINFLCNFLYAVYLLIRNNSMRIFIEHSEIRYWGWALFMGITWPLGIILYGIGAARLGSFGGYAGFPILLICSILGSNLVGALIGEWRGTRIATKRTMQIGVIILIIAAALFAYSNSLMGM